MVAAAVIPAYNEEPTIAGVVDAARRSPFVDEVVVVDNGSTDGTREEARRGGARVIPHGRRGKGGAMLAGVQATSAPVIVFLDGDLTGLRTDHVDQLVRPVQEGRAGMVCGLFDRGRLLNAIFLHVLPILTGERALRRELFESLDRKEIQGYKVEAALNSRAAELDLPVEAFVCDRMWHRTKEEKAPVPLIGFARKVVMLLVAVWGYLSYWVRRRIPAPVLSRRSGGS